MPKFKVGNWIICDENSKIRKITSIKNDEYSAPWLYKGGFKELTRARGIVLSYNRPFLDAHYRLLTKEELDILTLHILEESLNA